MHLISMPLSRTRSAPRFMMIDFDVDAHTGTGDHKAAISAAAKTRLSAETARKKSFDLLMDVFKQISGDRSSLQCKNKQRRQD
jgi:hypothetical protein